MKSKMSCQTTSSANNVFLAGTSTRIAKLGQGPQVLLEYESSNIINITGLIKAYALGKPIRKAANVKNIFNMA